MLTRDELVQGLDDRDLGVLEPLLRPSLRLLADPRLPRVGWLGGGAVIDEAKEWPAANGHPQLVLATLDGATIERLLPGTGVPTAGLTSYLYDATLESHGFDPAANGWSRVTAPASAPRREPPGAGPRLREVAVGAALEWTIPTADALEIERLELDEDVLERFYDLAEWFADESASDGPVHRIGGWPDPIQGDPFDEAQMAWAGIDAGGPDGYAHPRAEAVRADRGAWRQILQVDTDEEQLGIMWGDVGRLHVLERADDPGSLRVVWQCA